MIKAIIIEDEQLAADRLIELIKETKRNIEITAVIPSVQKSIEWLTNNKCDLIFLDIHLSDGESFLIFDRIKIETPIIFVTAYDKYAIKAFKVNSIDYLLKPISIEDLNFALDKFSEKANNNYNDVLKSIKYQQTEYKKRFMVQVGNKIKVINSESISAFYAKDKNSYLLTESSNSYIVDYTLDSLEDYLDPSLFFRINRKIIININSINSMETYTRSRVYVKLNQKLPNDIEPIVSIERASEFKSWLNL